MNEFNFTKPRNMQIKMTENKVENKDLQNPECLI